MLESVTPADPPNMSVMAARSQLILLKSESSPTGKNSIIRIGQCGLFVQSYSELVP